MRALVIAVLLLASDARAESADDLRSENVALGISLGATVGSWSLIGLSLATLTDQPTAYAAVMGPASIATLFAPSLGHWYAGKLATRGFKERIGGGVIAGVGVIVTLAGCPLFADECSQPTTDIGVGLMIAGGGLYLWGTIDDLVTVRARVRERNQLLHDVAIAPILTSEQSGFAVVGQF